MKEQSRIPVSKVRRASKFISTGAKVGTNYIKHYSKKMLDPEVSREQLDEDNASDIYESLSELKGSALKVAQMLSMDKSILPTAYQNKFAMSQYSAPPLSFPLVVKTFREYFQKSPDQIFDTFTHSAVNAASIGQVHKATLDGQTFAVKIQYPGVRESIRSDLKMVRPIATAMFKINPREMDQYMGEVESKLFEETDYILELERSTEIPSLCSHLKNVIFPNYYEEYSAERILVMDWMDGKHLRDWLKTDPSQDDRNKIGQALWDFYNYQIHRLKMVHADPHPGNFIISPDNQLVVIDFGCVKVIPEDFYEQYFSLLQSDILNTDTDLEKLFLELGFLSEQDSPKEIAFFTKAFKEMIDLLGQPFRDSHFNFGDQAYFNEIYSLGEKLSKSSEFRDSKSARGNKHGLYVNRTYFGLYTLLNDLGAVVRTDEFK